MSNNISSGTIARTIVLALALVNQIFAIVGITTLDIAENDIYQIVSLIFTVGASIAAWWRNNSFTPAAVLADETLKNLKSEEKK